MPSFLIDRGDHVRRKVDDLLQVLRGDVQQVAQARRDTLEIPDVRHRSSEFDVTHPLTAYLGPGHLDTTPLTDDALEAHPLVLTAVALPVPRGAEDLLAEQAITLWLERPVVDRLRLLHFTMRPLANLVGRGQADTDLVEEVHVEHSFAFLFCFSVREFQGSLGAAPPAGYTGAEPSCVHLDFFDSAEGVTGATRQVDAEILRRAVI